MDDRVRERFNAKVRVEPRRMELSDFTVQELRAELSRRAAHRGYRVGAA